MRYVLTPILSLSILLLTPSPTVDMSAPGGQRTPVHKYAVHNVSRQAEYREVVCTVTAYCNCPVCTGKRPGDKGYGITATGTQAGHGTLAADWGVFEPGTVIEIPGYGTGRVEDKGGAIGGYDLDVFMDKHEDCLKWGRQTVRVRVEE